MSLAAGRPRPVLNAYSLGGRTGRSRVPRAPDNALPSLAPMLSVRRGADAVAFYKTAFGAKELFKIEDGGSVVAQLAVQGAKFWVADESPPHHNFSPETLGGATARFVLVVRDPKAVYAKALAAGPGRRPLRSSLGDRQAARPRRR